MNVKQMQSHVERHGLESTIIGNWLVVFIPVIGPNGEDLGDEPVWCNHPQEVDWALGY